LTLTPEQQAVVDHMSTHTGLVLTSAIAGAGKTSLLKAISNSLNPSNALYMAYNKSLATEAKGKFHKSVDCRTVHSLAYQATVIPYKLNVGFFNPKHMSERMSYDDKTDFIEAFREYCLSEYISMSDFVQAKSYPSSYINLGDKYANLMHQGDIDCTHDFYLKLFHILLAEDHVTYDTFDLILWDEIQDMAPVATQIFELLPATRKIGVGDKHQAIYSFNHTVNYFELAPADTPIFIMTQSFRVPEHIASRVESFCSKYLDQHMQFKGIVTLDSPVETRAYLTRTNAALISKMIELNSDSIPYTLVRDPKEIFKLPLVLCSLKYKGFIPNPEFRHLQDHVNEWHENPDLRDKFKSAISYISNLYDDDIQFKQATRLLMRYGKSTIIEAFNIAKSHVGVQTNYTLCTAHASKGLEWDEITIATDLNDSLDNIIADIKLGKQLDELTIQERESLNLYYVSCTRSKVKLLNAKHL
jgi:F-box protein 18 (helicase)